MAKMNADKLKIALGCYTDVAHPNGLKVLELDEVSGAMSVRAEELVGRDPRLGCDFAARGA